MNDHLYILCCDPGFLGRGGKHRSYVIVDHKTEASVFSTIDGADREGTRAAQVFGFPFRATKEKVADLMPKKERLG